MIKHLLLCAAAAAATFTASAAPAQAPVQKVIPSGYTVTPGQGATITKLETITIKKNNEYYMDNYINRVVKVNGESIPITQKVTGGGSTIVMTLGTPVEKSGEYTIVVPAATFTYGLGEIDNPEMSWTLTIDNPDQPITPDLPDVTAVATPATGSTLPAVEAFSVTFEGADALVVADDTASKITVTSLGNPVETTFAATAAAEGATLELTMTPGLTLSGEYTVTLAEGAVTLKSGENEFASPEVKINYTVKAPLIAGDKFVVDKIRYYVISAEDRTAATTFPTDEADYAGLTAVPSTVTYEDITYTVTEIGNLTFSEVSGIKQIAIPETVTRIGEAAFWESTITAIEIPASVTELGESAFESCKQLKSFTLPATVTSVGSDLLYDCAQLETLNLPDNMTAIPARFAQGCVMLKSVDLPAGIKTIGEFAFSECDMLSGVTLPEGLTTLERFAFAKDLQITSMPIPETVTTMGHGVFYGTGLTEASLPAAITVIPDGTFQTCTGLTEFTVGNEVTEIEKEAFYWCFGLEKITFGEKLATIGTQCFKGDTAISEVICLNPEPATGAVFEEDVYANALLIVPDDSADAYKAAEGWKEFSRITTPYELAVGTIDSAATYTLDGRTVTLHAAGAIYNAAGALIFSGEGSIELPDGAYVISAAGRTAKILL